MYSNAATITFDDFINIVTPVTQTTTTNHEFIQLIIRFLLFSIVVSDFIRFSFVNFISMNMLFILIFWAYNFITMIDIVAI